MANEVFPLIRCSKNYKENMLDVSEAIDNIFNTATVESELDALKKLSFAAYKAMKYIEKRIAIINASETSQIVETNKQIERKL